MNRYFKIVILLFTLLAGIIIGLFISGKLQTISEYKELHSGQKRLTNKLLDFDIPPSKELGDYKNLLENLVNDMIKSRKATAISAYYRDLNNGPWIGVNHNEMFIPASLLKIPLMMVYLKKSEKDPSILSKKLKFKRSDFTITSEKYYAPTKTLQDGSEYTVLELIRRMIINSDNEALFILSTNVDVNEQKKLYDQLGFILPPHLTPYDKFASARNIASFFRVLYNATYLNEDISEKALQLLTETDFKDGITAGVPAGIVVAQKYGEREENGIRELHDCGIVYYPKHPYILCIMTKGTNYESLNSIIKDISKLTYEQVKISN